MITKRQQLDVSDQSVEVVYKDIKNLHLSVHPPIGRVRVAAPLRFNDDAVRLAVVSRLGWIRRQQEKFALQERLSAREMITGESHYFRGRRYRLAVYERDAASVRIPRNGVMELNVKPNSDTSKREGILYEWYRDELRADLQDLLPKWEAAIGVRVSEASIKRMKTRWGSCNPDAGRVWLNLELAKKPTLCVEYVLVHEMVHLLERRHNDNFRALMDEHMPLWRLCRDELNRAPLAHEDWRY